MIPYIAVCNLDLPMSFAALDYIDIFYFLETEFISSGSCKKIGCSEMNLEACKKYGVEKNVRWRFNGTWDPDADDRKPAPDHCYIKLNGNIQGMFFNHRQSLQDATKERQKVCSCSGTFILG